MHARLSRICALTLLLLSLPLTGCGLLQRVMPPVVASPRLSPLPAEALQPSCPAVCTTATGSCACSASLTEQRERWQLMLTEPAPQDLPASVPTKR